MSLTPSAVDTTAGSANITIEARIIDDVSGNKTTRIRFESPSSTQFVEAVFESPQRISGTAVDGLYRFVMTLPMTSEPGLWTVSFATLVDMTDTSRSLTAADLQAGGLPTRFTVT